MHSILFTFQSNPQISKQIFNMSPQVISKANCQPNNLSTRVTSASYDLCIRSTVHSKILANLQFIITNKKLPNIIIILNDITWWWGSSFGDMESISTSSLSLLSGPLWPGVVIPTYYNARIELFKNYSYLMQKFKERHKNVNMNKITQDGLICR